MSEPRTVLFFDHTALLGGGEIALLHLVTRIDRTKYRPVVLLSEAGPLADRLREAGVETNLLELPDTIRTARKDTLKGRRLANVRQLWLMLTYVRRLERYIRQSGARILHTNSLKSDILGGFAGRLARVHVIWHVRDRIEPDYLPGVLVRAFRALCRVVPNTVIANSHSTLETLLLPAAKPAHVAYSGLSDLWRYEQPANSSERTGRTADSPVVGIVGRIAPWKGQHIFIEAASRVIAAYPNARFRIIGSPLFGETDYEASLRSLAVRLGVADSIEFLGHRSDVPEQLAQLTLFVHASVSPEPFGQVVLQAMAAGLPIVATRGGGVSELIEDGNCGLLVPRGDVEATANAILTLLADPERSAALGEEARKRARSHFTIERTVEKIQSIYDSIQAVSI